MTIRGGVPFHIDSSAVSLYDLKSLGRGYAEQEAFMKYVANNKLQIQAAFYFDLVTEVIGHPPARFSWIAVERDPPHMMAVHSAGEWLEIGRYEYQKILQHYRDFLQLSAKDLEKIKTSGYHEDERVLPVPAWFQKQYEQRGFDEY